ncbi:DUF4062 domain-containing protein, partial [Planctomycetota bacterium]
MPNDEKPKKRRRRKAAPAPERPTAGTLVLKAMVSSTTLDLPDHRAAVRDACLRVGMMPLMMEQMPASDTDAITKSLALVDKADIYVGVFAHRYGHEPKDHEISITQMEYERAIEREIPRLIFLIHDDHPIKIGEVDAGAEAEKLNALKERLKDELVVGFFTSPDHLGTLALHALTAQKGKIDEMALVADLHPLTKIPKAPTPYIAHRFTLLTAPSGLIGRREELNLLTDWVTRPEATHDARIFCLVAIGGMGKSALTWHWFNEVAPRELTGDRAL